MTEEELRKLHGQYAYAWKFFRKYAEKIPVPDEDIEEIITELDELGEDSEFLKDIIKAFLNELIRRDKAAKEAK